MNIFEKLQKCRVDLQNTKPKKSGHNKFSDYDYFELGDFLPVINKLFYENQLCGLVFYGTEKATLTIIDTEKIEDKIEFSCQNSEASLKGCHAIQNIGAIQTYQRRYLYMTALEISESDMLDQGKIQKEDEPSKKAKELTEEDKAAEVKTFETQLVDEVKLKTIRNLLAETSTDEEQFCNFYNMPSLDFMDNATFVKSMKSLSNKKAKMPKETNKPILDI